MKYKVETIVTYKKRLFYELEAESMEDAKREIEDGGYVPYEEEDESITEIVDAIKEIEE